MPAQPSKTAIIPFKNLGYVSKVDGKAIPPGAFQFLENIVSEVEGSITVRRGRQSLGSPPTGGTNSVVTFAHKTVVGPGEVPGVPSTNLRYLQQKDVIYRTDSYATGSYDLVASGVCDDPAAAVSPLWSAANYNAGASGAPWAFFACQKAMLKDYGLTPFTGTNSDFGSLQTWGIQPASGVCLAVSAGPGNLDGGAVGSPAGSLPYSYIFAFRNDVTGNVGNPSQFMLSDSTVGNGIPLGVNLESITVTVYGTDDPQISQVSGHNTIAVYRAGGTFADSFYRLVGYTTNPGFGHVTTFTDNNSDISIAGAPQAEYDNNPPVVSSLQTPYLTNLASTPGGVGYQNLVTTSNVGLRTGSTIHISAGPGTGSNSEDAVIGDVSGDGVTITCFIQYPHAATDIIECDSIAGLPCSLVTQAFDSLFVAGDPNNPHVLYKSKTGLPESFPIIDALGNAGSINVGSPSNPIIAICEFRGNIVCLNAQNIFEVPVFGGVMYAPNVTPAQRGLIASKAWCIADNEIWYLAYDGIYSWSGGESVKRSEAIDQIFHNLITPVNPGGQFSPLPFSPENLQYVRMEYYRGQVHFVYADANGVWHDFYYDLVGQRWSPASKNLDGTRHQTGMLTERDTGNFIYFRHGATSGAAAVICLDDALDANGLTSDEFAAGDGATGVPIVGQAATGWLDFGNEYVPKIFDEVWLDIDVEPGASNVSVLFCYDYQVAFTDQFTLNVATAGRQWICLDLGLLADTTQPSNPLSTFGRQASVLAMVFVITTQSGMRSTIYGVKFKYRETAELTAGPYFDWDDCGHPYDKRFYEITVEFDTNVWAYAPSTGAPSALAFSHMLVMDTLIGVGGTFTSGGTQSFQISNAVTTILSPGRGLATFPIKDGVIAKMVRIRTAPFQATPGASNPSGHYFRILNLGFKKEDYPPDIVPFCEWQDNGDPYLKYANQLVMDVDTGGFAISVQIQADGAVAETVSINTTGATRDVTLTLNPNLSGRKWRWFINPATDTGILAGGKFQVFASSFRFQPADRGEVGHTFDWDDLGHPYDKLLQTVVIEYDTTLGGAVTLQMDTISGIGGTTLTVNVAQYTLGVGRGKTEFPIAPDTVAKMIRLYPVGSLVTGYKQWKYTFQKIDYPPDKLHITEWRLASSPTDKEPSWLSLDMDTSGVAATVQLQNELGTVMTVSHTGTFNNRVKNYAVPIDTRAKMWRLILADGAGGRTQLFEWNFQRWNTFDLAQPIDPPEIILATPYQDLGYPYSKLARNLILTINTGGVPCAVNLQTSEGNTVETFSVTTTFTNRRVILACNSELIGTLWRLTFAPGAGGLAQLWSWMLDYVKEPPLVTMVDTYVQDFGFNGFKWLKQWWVQYQSTAPVTMTILVDGGATFYTVTLPTHAARDMERGYFPAVNAGVLNKSKVYRVQFVSAQPFKLYSDTRLEWLPWNGDQRASFQQFSISPEIQMAVG